MTVRGASLFQIIDLWCSVVVVVVVVVRLACTVARLTATRGLVKQPPQLRIRGFHLQEILPLVLVGVRDLVCLKGKGSRVKGKG